MTEINQTDPTTKDLPEPEIRGGASWSPPKSTQSENPPNTGRAPSQDSSLFADLASISIGAVSAVVLFKSASFLAANFANFYLAFSSTERDPVWRGIGLVLDSSIFIFNLAITFVSALGVWYSWSHFHKHK